MRLFGFEITRASKDDGAVWVRAGQAPLGLLLNQMTPDELRTELKWVAAELKKGNTLYISARDQFKRVLSSKNYNQD